MLQVQESVPRLHVAGVINRVVRAQAALVLGALLACVIVLLAETDCELPCTST